MDLTTIYDEAVVAKISKVGGFSRRCNGQEPLLHLIFLKPNTQQILANLERWKWYQINRGRIYYHPIFRL
jgi:hypothetical protein